MTNALDRLTEWRCAERRRDEAPEGSVAWLAAIDDIHEARLLFHAEVAQVTARLAEAGVAAADARWPLSPARTPWARTLWARTIHGAA